MATPENPHNSEDTQIGKVNSGLGAAKEGYNVNAGRIRAASDNFDVLHTRLGSLIIIIEELFELDPHGDSGPIGEVISAAREGEGKAFSLLNHVAAGTENTKLLMVGGLAAILNDQMVNRRPTWEEMVDGRLYDITMKLYELITDVEVARDEAGLMADQWHEMSRRSEQVADGIEEYQNLL